MNARDLMIDDVKTVSAGDDVATVFHTFARNPFSGFPVVDDDGVVVGVITESDLVDLFEPEQETLWIPIGLPPFVDTLTYQVKPPWADLDLGLDLARNADRPITEVMTADAATVGPDTGVDEILELLSGDDPDINRLPVVADDGTLVGLIARQDVVRAFRDERL
jgi:Predicted transcriptional regulator containing CBS domains